MHFNKLPRTKDKVTENIKGFKRYRGDYNCF